ncbi:MAG TPA: peptidylprolyl isomerase [Bacteroidota bacterium]|nr:peptidylprolyl isomerase [Bacteroidota bacterium]
MPLMTKIRESLSTFFSIFAGLFVIYIVLDWGMDITGRRHQDRTKSQEIGEINGHVIYAKDFADLVRRAADNQKKQSGTEPDEEQQKSLRDQIWNELVDQTLYDDQIKRLGITVPDQEIVDWVRGDNPPSFLKQQFTDSTGTFNRQQYEATIMDPKNKDIMVQVEDGLRKQREREKLQSIILASVQVDEDEILQRFLDQNTKYNADYMLFDPNVLVKDSAVKFSEDDVRRYYNEHSDEYKVDATRQMKYVLFPNNPSHADTASVLTALENIQKSASEGADFVELARQQSESPVGDSLFHKHGDLPQDEELAVFSAKAGDLVGPLKEIDGYHFLKVLEFRSGQNEAIHASHILINIENNDSARALQLARDVLAQAKNGKDFATLAMQYSKDPGTAQRGGDLGWFGKGRMVKPFEDAAFKARVGQIVGPIRTTFGYHIIKIIARDDRDVRVADLRMPVHPSSDTQSDISQHAQDFVYLAKQGSFDREAEQSKYRVQVTAPFQKGAVIPGFGINAEINKFAFNNKLGSISDPFQLQQGYVVFMISDVKEAGIRPFDELKINLEARLRHDKKVEVTKTNVLALRKTLAPGDSLGKLAMSQPGSTVQHLADFTLGGFIPAIGRDLNFIGATAALRPGEISPPVEGLRGIYLIQLKSKSAFDSSAYNTQRETLRTQILTEKKNRFFTDWTDQLKKNADIVDNRDTFYR